MAIQADASGFLIGRRAGDLMARLASEQAKTTTQVAGLRRDAQRILSALTSGGRAPRSFSAPAVAMRSSSERLRDARGRYVAAPVALAGRGRTSVASPATASRAGASAAPMSPAAVAQASAGIVRVARAAAATAAATTAAEVSRAANGRFMAGGGRGGVAGGVPGRTSAGGSGGGGGGGGYSSGGFGAARRGAVGDIAGSVADVDAVGGAAREVASVAAPVKRLLFGDPAERRAIKEEKAAEKRQERSEKWFERIYSALGGVAGGGLMSFIAPLFGMFKSLSPLAALGNLLGGAGRAGRLGKFGKFGMLGMLLAGGSAMANEGTENPVPGRYRIGGGIAGTIAGGILGLPFGPAGVAIGSILGGIFGEKVGEWTKTLIDADIPGRVISWFTGKPAASAATGAAVMGGSLADSFGRAESGGDYGNDAQRRKFLAGRGGSTASGKYQFLDGTFADVASRSSDPALSGIQGLANAYLADQRGPLAKARDPKYAALYAAKLMPGPTEAAFREFTAANIGKLRAAGIPSPSRADVYGVHVLGGTALARAMRRNPNAPVSSVATPLQMAKNPGLFSGVRTVGDLAAKMQGKVGGGMASLGTLTNSTPYAPPPMPSASSGSKAGSAPIVVTAAAPAVGRDLDDRGIAHTATGGYSGGMMR